MYTWGVNDIVYILSDALMCSIGSIFVLVVPYFDKSVAWASEI